MINNPTVLESTKMSCILRHETGTTGMNMSVENIPPLSSNTRTLLPYKLPS